MKRQDLNLRFNIGIGNYYDADILFPLVGSFA
jgi:hypothetical protein